jgi:transposase
VGKDQRLPSELEIALTRARKELAEVKMERDLLSKFVTYCAKASR